MIENNMRIPAKQTQGNDQVVDLTRHPITIMETHPIDQPVFDVNRITRLTQPKFTLVDDYFRIDSEGKIYLKEKIDLERVDKPDLRHHPLKIDATGIPTVFAYKGCYNYTVHLAITVEDVCTTIPQQELIIDLPEPRQAPLRLGQIKTEGDEPKSFRVEGEHAEIFSIDATGQLTLEDTNFLNTLQPTIVQPNAKPRTLVSVYEYHLPIAVSDGTTESKGWVTLRFRQSVPGTEDGAVNFAQLAKQARDKAPPPTLPDLLDIDVPETSEFSLRTLRDIADSIKNNREK